MKRILASFILLLCFGCEVYSTEQFVRNIKPQYSYHLAFNYPIIPNSNGFTLPIEKYTLDPDTVNYCNRLLKSENLFVKVDRNGNILTQTNAKIIDDLPNLGALKKVANGEYWGIKFNTSLANATLNVLRFDANYNQVGDFSFKSNEMESISGFVPKPAGGILAYGISGQNLIVVDPEQKKLSKVTLNTSDYVRSAYSVGENTIFWIANYNQNERQHFLLRLDKNFEVKSKTEITSSADMGVVSDFFADGTPYLFDYSSINAKNSLRIFSENAQEPKQKEINLPGIYQSIMAFDNVLLVTTFGNKSYNTKSINKAFETTDFFESPISGSFFRSGSDIVKIGTDFSDNKKNRFSMHSKSIDPKTILEGQNYNKCYGWSF